MHPFVRLLRHPIAILSAITLLALLLRLFRLSYHGYYDDEIISVLAARPPIAHIFSSLPTFSLHPPLYYLLLHGWMRCCDSLVGIRMFSVLVGTASVPLIYQAGRVLISVRVGLVAAALVAVSPSLIFHSQQARMYPLIPFLILVALLLFHDAWQQQRWLHWSWGAFALVVALGFYTHVYVPFSLLAFNVWALIDSVQRWRVVWVQWGGLVMAQALGLLAFLPFVPQMSANVNTVENQFWLASNTAADWLVALVEHTSGVTLWLRPLFLNSSSESHGLLVLAGVAALVVAVVVMVLTIFVSLREAWQKPAERGRWLLLHSLCWTPILVATAISLTIKPILISRYLIGIAPPLALLMAWLVVRFWQKTSVRVVMLLSGGSMIMSLMGVYPATSQPNERLAFTEELVAAQREGDAMAYSYVFLLDALVLTHPEVEHLYMLPGPVIDRTEWAGRMAYLGWPQQGSLQEHIQPVSEFAPRYRRVWLALTQYDPDFAYHQQTSQQWLEEHGTLVQQRRYGATTIFLYDLEGQSWSSGFSPDDK